MASVAAAAAVAETVLRYQIAVRVDAVTPRRRARLPSDSTVNDVPTSSVH